MAYSLSWSSELHRAAGEGDAVELQKLLEEGHDPDERSSLGCWLRGAYQSSRTPLHLAAKGDHLTCIRLLLRYGGTPMLRTMMATHRSTTSARYTVLVQTKEGECGSVPSACWGLEQTLG